MQSPPTLPKVKNHLKAIFLKVKETYYFIKCNNYIINYNGKIIPTKCSLVLTLECSLDTSFSIIFSMYSTVLILDAPVDSSMYCSVFVTTSSPITFSFSLMIRFLILVLRNCNFGKFTGFGS